MTDVRWVAMGFDKKTERLIEEIELSGLTTDAVRQLLRLRDDEEAIGVSFDILPEHVATLARHAHGRLDLSVADWQIEARPAAK